MTIYSTIKQRLQSEGFTTRETRAIITTAQTLPKEELPIAPRWWMMECDTLREKLGDTAIHVLTEKALAIAARWKAAFKPDAGHTTR